MGRKKALRIKEAQKLANVFSKEASIANEGLWNKTIFKNSNPIILELGCGKGEYSLELARQFPEKNYLGIDRKADRIWNGATNAAQDKLENVFFIQSDIESIDQQFAENEISEIWITFPDPYLKKPLRRLTSPNFLVKYKKILKPGSLLHVKTDEERLYEFTLAVLEDQGCNILFSTSNLYQSKLKNHPEASIKTTYETKHIAQGDLIFYITFRFVD